MKNIIKNKYLKIISLLLCAALGILLILGGEIFSSSDKEAKCSENSELMPDADEYARAVEERIIRLCSEVRGAGRVYAVVTLSGGYNAVYAQNSQSSGTGYRNEFVMSGGGSQKEALLIGYTPPIIAGIGIICTGGDKESVRCELVSLVSAAFGVSTNKIYVAASEN